MTNPDPRQPHFERIETNGVTLRVVVEGTGPLCVLVHGWPELWLSWRHQIGALVAAGYRVAVPDVRGYGGSDCPEAVESYDMLTLTDDIVGVIDALGDDTAILIGHDWGAPIVWNTALLHPQRVRAVAGMSVPHLGRGPKPPTELLAPLYEGRFFYVLYFQQDGVAEAELEADVASSLAKIYFASSGDVTSEVRHALRQRGPDSGYLDGMVVPDPFPSWLDPDDLAYYAAAFERSGFRGGINRYRNMDRDWHLLAELDGQKITQPALFIAGQYDSVLRYVPGIDLLEVAKGGFNDLRGAVIIPGAGHWVQQERPAEVNAVLLEFLGSL